MSTPFVAAIIDVVGIVIYMNMALLGARYLFDEPSTERGAPASDVKAHIPDVELQDLALNLQGADQDPDLVRRELPGIRFGQSLQFIGHRRVLIGGRLQAQPHFLPCLGEHSVVSKVVDGARAVGQKQAEASYVTSVGFRLKLLDAFG
jgi:hypothetical protein